MVWLEVPNPGSDTIDAGSVALQSTEDVQLVEMAAPSTNTFVVLIKFCPDMRRPIGLQCEPGPLQRSVPAGKVMDMKNGIGAPGCPGVKPVPLSCTTSWDVPFTVIVLVRRPAALGVKIML